MSSGSIKQSGKPELPKAISGDAAAIKCVTYSRFLLSPSAEMPRPKYCITEPDLPHARSYIFRILHLGGGTLKLGDEMRSEYYAATDHRKKAANQARNLNAWCERYLTRADWHKMKLAIRKQRQRWSTETKTITISALAFEKLNILATRDGVTYSECLEKWLGKSYRRSRL